MNDFDLIVVGSGPAGEKGAAQAAYFGKRVALIERDDRLGGAPVNRGGLPTKTLRETALYLTSHRRRDVYGIGFDLSPDITLERMHRRAAVVSETTGTAVRRNLERHNIELVRGNAALGEGRSVEVELADGGRRTLTAEVILIATGSRPFHPDAVPFDEPDVHDSDTILEVGRIPSSMVVIGGGPVGCEYASIFAALGARVTLLDRAPRLMPFLDPDVSEQIRDCIADMNVRLLLGSPPAVVAREEGKLVVRVPDGETLETDMVLFAAGRSGNTEALRLAEAGVDVDERGRIIVDDEYRTSVPGIFAAGDVIGPPALASVSAEQGRVAMCHAFDIPFKETVDPLPPFGIYSIPEVAMVGLTEDAAAKQGIDVEVGRYHFSDNPRSLIAGTTYGVIKLVFRRDDLRLLGVQIVGEEAAELVHVGQAVIHAEGSIERFIHTTFNIPTRSEAYKYAAYDGLQRIAHRGPDGEEPSDST